MKLFLKPTAFLAAIVLLFSACSEDDTDLVSLTPAGSPEETSITAGDGRFIVNWVVPVDEDDNIDRCQITWEGPVDGSYTLEAHTEDEVSHEVTGLTAGEYKVTIQNYGSIQLDSPAVSEYIYVYDASTYENYMPEVENMFISGTEVVIAWENRHEDCQGVSITYTNTSGYEYANTGLKGIDVPVVVSDIKGGTSYTYTATFQPEGGLDPVIVSNTSEAKGTFPSFQYIDEELELENVFVHPGDFLVKVGWTKLTGSTPEKIVVSYDDGAAKYYRFVDYNQVEDDVDNPGMSCVYVTDIPNATYDIEVRSYVSQNVSDAASFDDIYVYDWDTYSFFCSAPTISSYVYYGDDYELRFSWEENDECKGLELEYAADYSGKQTVWVSDSETPLSELMILESSVPGSAYTATATYYPAENSLNSLTRTTKGAFPSAYVWKASQDRDNALADYDFKWSSYPMPGDATVETGSWSVDRIFDSQYVSDTQYSTKADYTASLQTVTLDLGSYYKLSKIVYTPYGTTTANTGGNLRVFNLYATNVEDPVYNSDYNGVLTKSYTNSQSQTMDLQIPNLTNWSCLLYNATVSMENAINNTTYYSFEFDISDTHDPMRYVRIQFVESFEDDRSNNFVIGELDFYHNGVWSEWSND